MAACAIGTFGRSEDFLGVTTSYDIPIKIQLRAHFSLIFVLPKILKTMPILIRIFAFIALLFTARSAQATVAAPPLRRRATPPFSQL
jgi:hypothetical protein